MQAENGYLVDDSETVQEAAEKLLSHRWREPGTLSLSLSLSLSLNFKKKEKKRRKEKRGEEWEGMGRGLNFFFILN
jgi:hypothetical protein